MSRPQTGEYNQAVLPYIELTKGSSVGELIANHSAFLLGFVEQIPEEKATYSYAEGKWSVKEVLQHVIDMERVFAFRALCIARGFTGDLPGVDQDSFAKSQRSKYRPFSDLQEEFMAMRYDHNILFRSFDKQALESVGMVNGHASSCNSWIYTSYGHTLYHIKLLRERYGL